MPLGISGRALGAALGVDEKSVRKAVAAGRIGKLADGSYDLKACTAAWSKGTDPARSKVRAAPVRSPQSAAPPVRTEADAEAAVNLIKRVLQGQGMAVDAQIGFSEARTADTILKAAERDLKIAQRRKELVPLARVKEHIEKSFIGIRQAIQRMPSRHAAAMAAELGCDAGELDTAMNKAIAAELDALSAPVVRA